MSNHPHAGGRIAVVLKGYPRLSETFIAQELRALELRGLQLALFSLRHPTEAKTHPVHAEIRAPVAYLPEYLYQEPGRVWRGWRRARRLPGYARARAAWLADLRRDTTANRGRRFGQALVLAAELPADIVHLHAHFLHTPASVTRYAALMRGLRWSCSAHAKDIWTTPDWEKREKLADCAWAATCTGANAEHLRRLASRPEDVDLVYHGLDAERFPPPPAGSAATTAGGDAGAALDASAAGSLRVPDGAEPQRPVVVLTVGRAVDKKGFDDLLAALAALPRTLQWRFEHVGGGPLLPQLRALADSLGIADRVQWLGSQAQQAVLARYRAADIFALPSRVSADGDRDGLPNVLMEAQSQKLPCVATAISGIPELIADGETGLLVGERDREALAAALARLIADPALRRRLGEAGYRRTTGEFSMAAGADRLAARFAACIGDR